MALIDFDKNLFLECCEALGVNVKPGTGKLTLSGKEFKVEELLDASFPFSGKRQYIVDAHMQYMANQNVGYSVIAEPLTSNISASLNKLITSFEISNETETVISASAA